MPASLDTKKQVKQKSGFYIAVTCPGCGGGLDLEDDLSILICEHCGSVLRVVFPDIPPAYMVKAKQTKREIRFSIDRFLKTKNVPLTGSDLAFKYVYYPYWKTDAVLLKLRNRIEKKVISSEGGEAQDVVMKQERTEISLVPYNHTAPAGHDLAGVPDSIGIRAQYIKMVAFSDENIDGEYQPMPVIRPWNDIWGRIRKSVDHMDHVTVAAFGKNRTELMYPSESVVYFPYVIVEAYETDRFMRFTVDGYTGRVLDMLDRPPAFSSEGGELLPSVEFGSLGVDFHRCRNCGVDLPPVKSFVSICKNCSRIDLADGATIRSEDLVVAKDMGQDSGKMFPFWSFLVPEDDASEIRRMFGGLYDSGWLTLPAFAVPNFEALYRLTKRLSAAVPKIETVPVDNLQGQYRPVTLSAQDARRLTGVVIHRCRITADPNCSRSDDLFEPVQTKLIYLPFRAEHYFFVDCVLGAITFERALVD